MSNPTFYITDGDDRIELLEAMSNYALAPVSGGLGGISARTHAYDAPVRSAQNLRFNERYTFAFVDECTDLLADRFQKLVKMFRRSWQRNNKLRYLRDVYLVEQSSGETNTRYAKVWAVPELNFPHPVFNDTFEQMRAIENFGIGIERGIWRSGIPGVLPDAITLDETDGPGVPNAYIEKVLNPDADSGYDPSGLIGFWPQDESAGAVSIDHSGFVHNGAYTAVNLGQPGVPGMGLTSAGYDGATSFNNIYSAGLANDSTLLNGGFETPGGGGADIWANYAETAGDGALANEVVIVHQGNDSAKMTSGVTSNTNVFGDAMVSIPGAVRRFRFFTYGDGVNAGRYAVYDITNGAYIIPITSTGITAAAWGMVAAQYTVPVGCISVRVEYWCPPVNGGVCYFDAGEVRGMDGFLGDQGTVIVPAQVANVGVWTDGVSRYLFVVGVGANNYITFNKSNVPNTIGFSYSADGVLLSQTTGGLFNTDFAFYSITWDMSAGATGEVRYFIDGIPSGAMDVGLGTWLGDLLNTAVVLGALSTVPASVWSGNIGPVLLYNEAKTPAEIAYLSTP